MENHITVKEAAKKLNVSTRTIWKYIRNDQLKNSKEYKGEKCARVLISENSVNELMNKSSQDTSQFNSQGSQPPYSASEALLQATYRVGWLESRLEAMQKAITEGEEAKAKAERLAGKVEYLTRENDYLKDRISELEMPWWRKVFRGNGKSQIMKPETA